MNYTKEQIYEYGMRDIKGYEGLYAVTSCGRIWSYKKKIFLKPCKTKKGYLRVKLYKSGKYKNLYVHRIVMETYNPCENMKDLQVNHKSEIKIDNNLNNLEWCTAKENINYGTHNERSAAARSKKVRCIETNIIYESVSEASSKTGISQGHISECCNGKRKTAGGFHWEFVD